MFGLKKLALLVAVGAAVLARPAFALDGKLKTFGGMPIIIVWKSVDARREGQAIIDAGNPQENIQLLVPLIACIEKPGTKVVVTDPGFATHDILVVQGENKGCRGNIAMEELDTRQP